MKQTRATIEDTHARLGPCHHDPSLPNVRRLLTEDPIAADREKYFVATFNLQECMERVYTERSVREMLAMSKLMMLYYPDNYLSGGLVSAL